MDIIQYTIQPMLKQYSNDCIAYQVADVYFHLNSIIFDRKVYNFDKKQQNFLRALYVNFNSFKFQLLMTRINKDIKYDWGCGLLIQIGTCLYVSILIVRSQAHYMSSNFWVRTADQIKISILTVFKLIDGNYF